MSEENEESKKEGWHSMKQDFARYLAGAGNTSCHSFRRQDIFWRIAAPFALISEMTVATPLLYAHYLEGDTSEWRIIPFPFIWLHRSCSLCMPGTSPGAVEWEVWLGILGKICWREIWWVCVWGESCKTDEDTELDSRIPKRRIWYGCWGAVEVPECYQANTRQCVRVSLLLWKDDIPNNDLAEGKKLRSLPCFELHSTQIVC